MTENENENESEHGNENEKLYENCTYIGGYGCDEVYAYTPTNELDEELFKLLTNNELLHHPNIEIKNEMNYCAFNCEQFLVGSICLFNDDDDDEHPICNICKLTLPVDLEYYTENDINVCHLCHNEKNTNTNMKITKINSDLDNVKDWVCIFTYNDSYSEYGYLMSYCYEFYCNLNTNSKYYKQFAINKYVDMLGDEFVIIEETCIDSIVNKYCNLIKQKNE